MCTKKVYSKAKNAHYVGSVRIRASGGYGMLCWQTGDVWRYIMAQKVSCEVRTITKRTGKTGPFWSINLADSGADGYARIPDAQFRSYSISDEAGWLKFKKAIETALKAYNVKSKLNEKKDVKGNTFWSTKSEEAPAVVIVDIELVEGFNLIPTYDAKLGATVVKLSGKLLSSTIRIRAQRPGNSVE